jgi:hypothetical protein
MHQSSQLVVSPERWIQAVAYVITDNFTCKQPIYSTKLLECYGY